MTIDVTDATFETEVLARSDERPVVVDLWAPWCGPCKLLGPILEDVIDATDGAIVLAKVDIDQNPQVQAAFRVQSIPAVFALHNRAVVDSFIGAKGQDDVRAFVDRLLPSAEQNAINAFLEAGDEDSLRQALELDPPNATVIVALAEVLVADGRTDEGLDLLNRIPETPEVRRVAALARAGDTVADNDEIPAKLEELLSQVKDDGDARQAYLDLLELLGPEDPRTADYRRRLTTQLF